MDAVEQEAAAREALARSLSLSMRSQDDDWYKPTLTRANALAARMYREIFGGRIPADTRAAITEYVEKALRDTKRNPDGQDAQVARLSRGLASYLASAVLDSNTPSAQWEKVWRTVHDDKVRDSHAMADGQVVDGDGYFTVGGVKMFAPGDLSAPAEEWAGCRCHSEYRRRTALPDQLVAAADIDPGGFVIVGLPAADDPIYEVSSEQPPHLTMIYLSVDFIEQAAQILAGEAPKYEPTTVEVTETGELGDGGAQVAHVNPLGLADVREVLLTYEPIFQGVEAMEQFPEWTPHVTLGYPETPPLSTDVPDTITIDRLAILDGSGALHSEYPLGEAMDDTAVEETPVEEVDEFPTSGVYEPVPLYGVLAPEGKPTGDRRGFAVNSLEWIEPPLSLRWQERDHPGHDDSVVVGTIDRIWREDSLIKWEGMSSVSEAADKHVALIAEKALRGISVDLDDAQVETRTKDGSELELPESEDELAEMDFNDVGEWVTYGRIRSGATCPIPAFPEVFVAIGTWAEHDAQQPSADPTEEDVPEELVASVIAEAESALLASGGSVLTFAPGTQDGPGWLTHPIDTDRLRDYWVRGTGGAKIGWGVPGDFNRCRAFLAEYIKPMYLAGYCANRHKDALGFWPGEHRPGKASAEVATFNLVASAGTLKPPREWFENPNFTERAPMTITEPDPHTGLRRVFGHAAEWDECHTGFADRCVSPPSSPSDYSRFHLGHVVLDDGTKLPTGTLTMDTGHAALSLNASSAAAHYDNTGTSFAQVRCGEDGIGIWFAGVVEPKITDEQVFSIRGAKISGDWRNVAGQGLDAIAMLAVNTPGFPIVHAALAASAGERQALVAAGIVEDEPVTADTLRRIVAAAVDERLEVISARQALVASATARRRKAMDSIAASAASRKDI